MPKCKLLNIELIVYQYKYHLNELSPWFIFSHLIKSKRIIFLQMTIIYECKFEESDAA